MEPSQISQDLQFVKQAVGRRDGTQPRPTLIYLYWSAYALITFPLSDFAPSIAGWVFLIGTVVGIIFSGIVARHTFAQTGETDISMRARSGLHWLGGMILAVGSVIIMANLYEPFRPISGQIACVMIGLIYFTAGIHFDRPFIWMGCLLVVGGTLMGLVPHYGSTILGVLLSASLFTSAMVSRVARPFAASLPCAAATSCTPPATQG